METKRTPTLPATAIRAGARTIERTTGTVRNLFVVGFDLVPSDGLTGPGKGAAVVKALRTHFMDRAAVSWGGTQAHAIFIRVL
jgi:hypothetical protein